MSQAEETNGRSLLSAGYAAPDAVLRQKSGGRDSSRAPRSLAQHSRQKSRPPFVWSKQPPQICAQLLITLDE